MDSEGDIEEFVISAIASACNCSRSAVTPEADVADLGLDSMSLTTLGAHIEAIYQCDLSEDLVQRLIDSSRVRDIVAIARQALAASAKSSGEA
jgi:acyl carrier protein